MKFELSNYEVLLPPYPLEYEKWDEAQAQDYLKWFVSKIPERVDYVCWRYHKDNIFSSKLNPDDPESLIRIWRWFLPRAKVEQMPKEVAEAHLAAFSHLGGRWLDTRQLSACTEYAIRDIGMMMGHIFTVNFPQALYWTTEKIDKRDVWLWHPVLKGFVYMVGEKKTFPPLEPIHIVGVQAGKVMDRRATASDLLNIYKYWEDQIPVI